MRLILFLLFVSFLSTPVGAAVIEPAEHATLHYTNVYFQDEFKKNAAYYVLIVSGGTTEGKTLRLKNTIPAMWANGLSWGSSYRWQMNAYSRDSSLLSEGQWHDFTIIERRYQSFNEIKVTINKNDSLSHAGGLLAIDYTRSIYDRSGRAVWTIPFIENRVKEATNIRDMKVTRRNTLTFLTIPIPMEIDFQGNVVWEAPHPFVFKNDTVVYHHQFELTPRGTYMVLGDKKVWRRMNHKYQPEDIKPEFEMKVVNGVVYKRILIAILLEFDKNGKLIWWWDANNYIKDEDLVHQKNKRGIPVPATHANAFGENSDGSKIYVGFRDLSRIVRIDKKTRKVEYSFGEKYPSGDAKIGDNRFKHQHDAKLTNRNTFFILNNNGALSMEGTSSIMELRTQPVHEDSLVAWQFSLDFDTLSSGKSLNGGNVNELPGGNVLLCGGALNRIIEVKKSGELVWDAFLYSRAKNDTAWQNMNQYRCSWLPNLPFYYFLAVCNAQEQNVKIYNTGLAGDRYEVELLDKNFKRIKSVMSGVIPPGGFEILPLPQGMKADLTIVRTRSINTGRISDCD